MRSALTDDGRAPLEASGLKLQDRLTQISDSLARVQQKKPFSGFKAVVPNAHEGAPADCPSLASHQRVLCYSLMKGAHTIHHYLQVELLTPHYYRASCRDNGQRLWDYTLSAAQLQHWLLPASRLIQTSPDPLCGIYTLPQGAPWTLSLQDNIEVIEREPITPFKEETFE